MLLIKCYINGVWRRENKEKVGTEDDNADGIEWRTVEMDVD